MGEFKAIDEDEVARYAQLAIEDKERYQAAMEDYDPPSDSDSDSDSNAPRNDVKEANRSAKFGEIAQIISRHFKALPEEERAYWQEKAAQDKERYLGQKESYEQTGTF